MKAMPIDRINILRNVRGIYLFHIVDINLLENTRNSKNQEIRNFCIVRVRLARSVSISEEFILKMCGQICNKCFTEHPDAERCFDEHRNPSKFVHCRWDYMNGCHYCPVHTCNNCGKTARGQVHHTLADGIKDPLWHLCNECKIK